jgi:hypothetical protein
MRDGAPAARYSNWISAVGAFFTTVSAVLWIAFFFLDLAGFHTNPYLGIVTFVLLPAVFVVGLLLIPLGYWEERRRVARGRPAHAWPVLDFSQLHVRRTAMIVLALTGVNIAIVSTASFKAVEYADSTPFCTSVCHTPMEPEALAHQRTVHASVSCAACHIGPGPQGFAQAKIGGVRRLMGVVTGNYTRPIPVPVPDLPTASGTCVACHTPQRYVGDRTRHIKSYSDDETTTEQVTTLIMKIGGGGFEDGGPRGIHWHASPQTRVEYVSTDAKRDTIAWVRVSDLRGTREYTAEGVTAAQIAAGERRVMDCTDCHNRAGHPIAPTIDRAVDEALATGLLPRLPFIRREAMAALAADYDDRETAAQGIAAKLTALYSLHPGMSGDARVGQAIAATQRLYADNVFPPMNVQWGTYPSHIGHTDAPGCFRCHDEQHKTTTGLVISQECETCHRMP